VAGLVKKIWALIRLVRPELPLAAGVCVMLGQAVGLGRLPGLILVSLGFLLGLLLSSSQMVFNDYFDLEVDRVNSPERPIAAGEVSPVEAVIFGVLTTSLALGIAFSLHPAAFLLSLVTWVLGFLYNWKLKANGIWGNLIVSTSVAMTFIIGGVSVGQAANPMVWLFGLIAFTFDLAEEIAGDAMDMQGDQKRGSRSIALVHGKVAALRISGLLFAGVILLTFLPLFLGETSLAYLVPIAFIDIVIAVFSVRLVRSRTPHEGRRAMRVLYISASLGLLVFLITRFF
jgi:geranylgeranylglycerol-phosphate geranylgeranyltransferase